MVDAGKENFDLAKKSFHQFNSNTIGLINQTLNKITREKSIPEDIRIPYLNYLKSVFSRLFFSDFVKISKKWLNENDENYIAFFATMKPIGDKNDFNDLDLFLGNWYSNAVEGRKIYKKPATLNISNDELKKLNNQFLRPLIETLTMEHVSIRKALRQTENEFYIPCLYLINALFGCLSKEINLMLGQYVDK